VIATPPENEIVKTHSYLAGNGLLQLFHDQSSVDYDELIVG
jgi:hypothetical protein